MGEAVEHLGHDDPLRPVDAHVDVGQPSPDAVVAEHVDDGERLHERRREQRQHRHNAKEAPPRHERPRHAIGVAEGQHHGDGHGDQRHHDAVDDRRRDGRRPEVARVVREPHEPAVAVERAPPRQLRHRIQDEQVQHDREQNRRPIPHEVLTTHPPPRGATRDHRPAPRPLPTELRPRHRRLTHRHTPLPPMTSRLKSDSAALPDRADSRALGGAAYGPRGHRLRRPRALAIAAARPFDSRGCCDAHDDRKAGGGTGGVPSREPCLLRVAGASHLGAVARHAAPRSARESACSREGTPPVPPPAAKNRRRRDRHPRNARKTLTCGRGTRGAPPRAGRARARPPPTPRARRRRWPRRRTRARHLPLRPP